MLGRLGHTPIGWALRLGSVQTSVSFRVACSWRGASSGGWAKPARQVACVEVLLVFVVGAGTCSCLPSVLSRTYHLRVLNKARLGVTPVVPCHAHSQPACFVGLSCCIMLCITCGVLSLDACFHCLRVSLGLVRLHLFSQRRICLWAVVSCWLPETAACLLGCCSLCLMRFVAGPGTWPRHMSRLGRPVPCDMDPAS